jgi:thioredoxin-related protein
MKFILVLTFLSSIAAHAAPSWLSDLDAAKVQAIKENKPLLVHFYASGWTPREKYVLKEVFDSAEFAAIASRHVLVELDYPKSNQQSPAVREKNAALKHEFGVSVFPTVILVDANSGEAFGMAVGFVRQTKQEYLDKLTSFRNTPQVRAAIKQEQKAWEDLLAKKQALYQKLSVALADKDFNRIEACLDELYADVNGPRKAALLLRKADLLLMTDPTAKEKALKYASEAILLAGSDERLAKVIKDFGDKIASGKSGITPNAIEPKTPADSSGVK